MKTRTKLSTLRELPRFVKNIMKLAYRRSGFPVRGLIIAIISGYENGEYWSTTLREIFLEVHGIEVGIGSYGCFRPDAFPRGTIIGNYCSIAPNVRFIGSNHPMGFASTHPMFYHAPLGFVEEEQVTRTTTTVGHDVWIGYNSLILSNCRLIGTGAIIAAGSIVTKDVEPYSVVAGVPAKPLKKRFNDEIACMLLESKWYLLKPNVLGEMREDVKDVSKFISAVRSIRNCKFSEKNHDV